MTIWTKPEGAPEDTLWFPPAFAGLWKPKRYKIFYGGRGGAKSWCFARALLLMGSQKPLRVLCCREIMRSIDDSVLLLLADQVVALGLEHLYDVQKTRIVGRPGTQAEGTLFIFAGLHFNVNSIKSKESIDIVWIEEARDVSNYSWNKLIPTIRKKGSEIWISFNPELDDDPTYDRFVTRDPAEPDRFIRVKVTYRDNPWFTDELEEERLTLLKNDPQAYLNVYEGECVVALEGAVFSREMARAHEEKRIMPAPWVRGIPVFCFYDLGWFDFSACIFAQAVEGRFRIIDYWEGRHTDIPRLLEILQRKPYVYKRHYLPHDADAQTQAAAGRTILDQFQAGQSNVEVVQRVQNKVISINAARAIFDRCIFNSESVEVMALVNHLRRYAYKVDPKSGRYSKEPEHNDHSHGADAFQQMGLIMDEPSGPEKRNRYKSGASKPSRSWITQ